MISLTTAILLALTSTTQAADFPRELAAYVCDTAPYYYTTSKDKCMMEQYSWYQDVMAMGLTDKQYNNALWYGQKYGYMGDVVGIDFKPVLQRAEYLVGQK